MGIIPSAKGAQQTPNDAKRKSAQLDFSSIGPLKTAGTVGFSTFRDHDSDPARQKKTGHKRNGSVANTNANSNAMVQDSDDDDDDDDDQAKILGKLDDADDKDGGKSADRLAPEDAKFSGELADGVNRIRVGPPFIFCLFFVSLPLPLLTPSSSSGSTLSTPIAQGPRPTTSANRPAQDRSAAT